MLPQHALFAAALRAEEDFAERQEYLRRLSHGAEEMSALADGLKEEPGCIICIV